MFQVANFEYVDEAEAAAEEEALKAAVEPKIALNSSERTTYWEDLLRDRYEVHKVEEFNSLGKGKRSRRQVDFWIYADKHPYFDICFQGL